MTLGPPANLAPTGSSTIANATAIYPGPGSSPIVVTVAQAIEGEENGLRLLPVLLTASAPATWRLPLALPAGATTLRQPDGSVTIRDANLLYVASIGAPLVEDDTGRALPATYGIQSGVLILRVDTANAVAPIVGNVTVDGSPVAPTANPAQDALNGPSVSPMDLTNLPPTCGPLPAAPPAGVSLEVCTVAQSPTARAVSADCVFQSTVLNRFDWTLCPYLIDVRHIELIATPGRPVAWAYPLAMWPAPCS